MTESAFDRAQTSTRTADASPQASGHLWLRRHLLLAGGAMLLTLGTAQAGGAEEASRFVDNIARELTEVLDSAGTDSDKRKRFLAIIDGAVDVEGIARFCLGRFWRQASQAQQQEYTALFHQALTNGVISRLGEYKGVRHTIGRSVPQNDSTLVQTLILRPNSEPAHVDWLVHQVGGRPEIEDLIVEGTSMRITQRSDYMSFLQRNGSNIQALIDQLRQQVGQSRSS